MKQYKDIILQIILVKYIYKDKSDLKVLTVK